MAKQEREKKSGEQKALQPVEERPVLSLFDEMDRMFDDFFTHRMLRPFSWRWPKWAEVESRFEARMPKVDVIDRDKEILIRAELPGVSKDDLDVSMTENSVTIRASTRHETKEESGEYYRREMSRGEFLRTLPLPATVDGEKAKASFKDGILELTLPKTEATKRRAIKVE